MSVELLQILSVVAYILAVVMLVLSIILFFVLNIRKVIGNLSGSTAKKAINDIRQKNEMSGRKSYKPSGLGDVYKRQGKITDKMTPSGNIANQGYGDTVSPITEKFSTLDLNPQSKETTILDTTADETTILNDVSASEDTVVLSDFNTKENVTKNTVESGQRTEIRTEVEIGFTDSDEIIE